MEGLRWCPTCDGEFVDRLAACPDCGTNLAAGPLPPGRPSMVRATRDARARTWTWLVAFVVLELLVAWMSKDGIERQSHFDPRFTATVVILAAPVAAIVALIAVVALSLGQVAVHGAGRARSRR